MKLFEHQLNTAGYSTFGAIIVPKDEVRSRILRSFNENQLKVLKRDLLEQQNNPVNAIIDRGLLGLKAKIWCEYRLKNFKEDYMQIPFFESNENFLKRIITKCNEYKNQLDL